MATTLKNNLDRLLDKEKWGEAEKLIRLQLKDQPENHWLWTQLGSVIYEQRKYKSSLKPLLKAMEIKSDCPLTLWHLAGTYSALGEDGKALVIYTSLLKSKTTHVDDSCWEDEAWTNTLKTDCVYRIGLLLQHQKNWQDAADFLHQYIELKLAGMSGSYSMEDAARHLAKIMSQNAHRPVIDPSQAFSSALKRTQVLVNSATYSKLGALIAG